MDNTTVNILGTEYGLSFDYKEKDADGEAKFYSKQIQIRPLENLLSEDSTENERTARQNEVIRHELFHCFFYEGTGAEYAWDENLISFLAVNSPKIFKLFKELDIL